MDIISKYYAQAVKGLTETVLEDEERWHQYVLRLPVPLRAAYTVSVLDKQVLNGGFDQYFSNRYGILAYVTAECLRHIKAFKTADILERALKKVNYQNLPQEDFRKELFHGLNKKINESGEELSAYLERLDDAYYKLFNHPGTEDLHQLLTEFLTAYESKNFSR